MQEDPLCQGNLLPGWKSSLTICNFYMEVFEHREYVRSYYITTNIAQPHANSWPVHPQLVMSHPSPPLH